MSICLSRFRDTRIEEDSDNSTSSKDLLVRNVFEELRDEKTWSMKCGNRLCRFACRSAPAMLAWFVQALELCSLATEGTQECFRGAPRRQAFSVVGVKKNMANPERKRRAKAREPYQNFDGESQLSESTKPLAKDWRGVWGVV